MNFSDIVKLNSIPGRDHETDDRFLLIRANLEKIEHCWLEADNPDCVVIAGNLNDPIIQGFTPKKHAEYAQKLKMEINDQNMQPTALFVLPRWTAYKMFSKIQKELHRMNPRDPKVSRIVEMLANPAPKGHFWVMAISKGKQLAALPCPTTGQ